jgi:hypothetical protein
MDLLDSDVEHVDSGVEDENDGAATVSSKGSKRKAGDSIGKAAQGKAQAQALLMVL